MTALWVVVFIAQDQEACVRITGMLENEGILVRSRPVSSDGAEFEILVPESESGEAHRVLLDAAL